MGESTTITIDRRLKKILALEKASSPDCRSIEDVIRANMDLDSLERKFAKLLRF